MTRITALAKREETAAPSRTTSFAPTTLTEAIEFSKMIASSDLAPKDFKGKPGNVLVAMQMGAEIGLSPMQAVQNIAVINGRPSVWGDAALAIVQGHHAYEWHTENVEGAGDNRVAVFIIKRKGHEAHTARFSVADAKVAGLWGKQGPWTTHPSRMLTMRARGFGLRDKFADALKGIITAEEAQDMPVEPSPTGRTGADVLSRFAESEKEAPAETPEPCLSAEATAEVDTPPAPEPEPTTEEALPLDEIPETPTLPSVTGVIEQVSIKRGKGKKGPWTKYGILIARIWYGTFDTTIGAEAEKAKGKTVQLFYNVEGQYNTVDSFIVVETAGKPDPENCPQDHNKCPETMYDNDGFPECTVMGHERPCPYRNVG